MTKRIFLTVFMVYASSAAALPVNILQAPSLVEQVNEGLHGTRPPLATLQDAWNSTFMIYFANTEKAEVGSAFVIRNVRRGAGRTLDLVTVDHVLGKWCAAKKCENYSVFAEGHLKAGTATSAPVHVAFPLDAPNLQILARDPANDLALIRITVGAEVNPVALRIARDAARNGDRVWTIGYPDVSLRKSKLGIDAPEELIRRWSEGQTMGSVRMTGDKVYFDSNATLYKGHTVDSLPGNSGGAVLNDQGEVIGVMSQSGSDSPTKYVYAKHLGVEKIPSVAVDFAVLKDFLSTAYSAGRPRLMSAN